MEWVSHLAGQGHSDTPACVSSVLRAFCTSLNDALDDCTRQRLRPYLPRTIGTAEDGLDEARSWMALDWLVRVYTPTWLTAARSFDSADALATLPPVVDAIALTTAIRAIRHARNRSRGLWAASLGAARVAAWLPRAAGRGAAREAAWSRSGRPAWAAAAIEIRTLACDRASALCREIAADAALTMIRSERGAANAVRSEDAMFTALAPTLARLHESTFGLLDRMLPAGALAPLLADDPTCPFVRPCVDQTLQQAIAEVERAL